MPSTIKVRNQYLESFSDLVSLPKIQLHDYLKEKYKPRQDDINSFGIQRQFYQPFDQEDLNYLPLDMKNYNDKWTHLI